MPRVGQRPVARPDRLRTRRCLSCGYAGPELQGDRGRITFRCPACAEDLYARPARSYAEMEGLDLLLEPPGAARPAWRARMRAVRSGLIAAKRHWLTQTLSQTFVMTATLALLALVIVLAGEFATAN